MKYCTNKDCPAKHCARQLITSVDAPGEVEFNFETYDDDGTFDIITIINGKQFGFHCEGYLFGCIA